MFVPEGWVSASQPGGASLASLLLCNVVERPIQLAMLNSHKFHFPFALDNANARKLQSLYTVCLQGATLILHSLLLSVIYCIIGSADDERIMGFLEVTGLVSNQLGANPAGGERKWL